jgi:hypothetical protein
MNESPIRVTQGEHRRCMRLAYRATWARAENSRDKQRSKYRSVSYLSGSAVEWLARGAFPVELRPPRGMSVNRGLQGRRFMRRMLNLI